MGRYLCLAVACSLALLASQPAPAADHAKPKIRAITAFLRLSPATYQAQVQEALVGITKLLKTRIGKELKLRYTPHLDFQFDDSVAKGFYIEELLQKA